MFTYLIPTFDKDLIMELEMFKLDMDVVVLELDKDVVFKLEMTM